MPSRTKILEQSDLPLVVIVGGGFGGLSAAHALKNAPVQVVLIDRNNHSLFQPLLYQVATSALNESDIAQPIRSVLRNQKNAVVILDEVTSVDTDGRLVKTGDLTFRYDYLILACGARHSYFGHPEWEEFAPGLKSLQDALQIRNRVLTAFEVAEKADDPAEIAQALTFVIVGGGPTGVELAGAIAETARHTLPKDFRRARVQDTRVILIESSPRVLASFSPEASELARRQLVAHGVEVRNGCRVSNVTAEGVEVDGEAIPARTVLWAAGNNASPLGATLGTETDKQGRVIVNPDLSLPGHPEVFVIGDMSHAKLADGTTAPGLSPAAMQGASQTAANILRLIRGQRTRPFRYVDKGIMATIGRNAAVVDVHGIRFGGFPAWVAWAGLHLFYILGIRQQIGILLIWIYSYFTYSKGSRLIPYPQDRNALLRKPPTEPVPSRAERENPSPA